MSKRVNIHGLWVAALLACSSPVLAQSPGTSPGTPPVVVEPIVPATPPSASVLSVQCAVPVAQISTPAPLARMIAQLESGRALRILAIGSSSTWGVGASAYRRNYPSQLERILEKTWKGLEVEIINRGVSGELAATTASRLISEAALVRPDLILWQLGTNDALARIPINQFAETVRSTVRLLRKSNMDVVLVGLQYTPRYARDEHYKAVRMKLQSIAAEENLLYVRRFQAMEFIARTQSNQQMMAEDNFHLNDLGYQCMAEHIAQAVIGSLFVRRPRGTPGPRT
ncbi:MAG: SGNH/GDSL hydrolase family protein [Alphaproteobacteria bacterium]|nr:SGNH/GDSL hydrolase family protein [Alphaproteobacteria bacterium]